jgi:hypothetical protein
VLEAECQGSGTNFSDYRVYQALLVLLLTSLRVETMVERNPQSRLYRGPHLSKDSLHTRQGERLDPIPRYISTGQCEAYLAIVFAFKEAQR